jgi:hypothetical protein
MIADRGAATGEHHQAQRRCAQNHPTRHAHSENSKPGAGEAGKDDMPLPYASRAV